MSSKRQRIEDAIVARLIQRLGAPNGRYLQLVEPYNGEIDQVEGPDDIRRALRGMSPVVLVGTGSGVYENQSAQKTRWKRTISIELFVASDHRRSREDRLRADVVAKTDPTADPGIYQITEDILDAIGGDCFGLDGVGRLDPIREDALLQEDDLTVWRVTYESMTDAIVNKRDHDEQQFTTYEIDGDLVDTDGETVLPDPPNPLVEADGGI